MRHRHSGRQLNRNSSHRKAMFRNMSCSLIEHKVIKTTLPKAKELRRVIEPMITHAKKNDSVAGRRHAFDHLRCDTAVAALFNDIAPRCKNRNGGYVRILKCGFRSGDKAPMAFVELIDKEDMPEVALQSAEVSAQVESANENQPENQPAKETASAGAENLVEAEAVTGDFDAEAAKAALGKKIKVNDLTIIEGIGPKIAEIFSNAGIATWADLASADVERCKAILAEAGDRYKMHDPNTWPRQAKLAAEGDWQVLADWQEELDGGREAE